VDKDTQRAIKSVRLSMLLGIISIEDGLELARAIREGRQREAVIKLYKERKHESKH
jgi:hypothetical protein